MIKINEILVYNSIKDAYYTDGRDIYIQIKECRVRCGNTRCRVNLDNISHINQATGNYYIFDNDILYKRLIWQTDKDGYHMIMSDSKGTPKKISQHRLVYFFHNNIIPDKGMVIDHIDRDRQHNDISNLRLCTNKENYYNSDERMRMESASRYLYRCVNTDTLDVIEGTAGDISSVIGIDNGLVNRYAKRGYKYKGKYIIEITERRY